MNRKRDFLSITDLTRRDILDILGIAGKLKRILKKTGKNKPLLKGKTLIMIYEKPSLRTHASFDIGMFQLGGHALYFGPEHIGLGVREPVEHAANVLSRMGNAIMARVFAHQTVMDLAAYSTVPVINGLSDLEHPCQILADIMTLVEKKGSLHGLHVAFVGDGDNNVTHSLALAGGLLGMHIAVASPKGYGMRRDIVDRAGSLAKKYGGSITETQVPKAAVRDADVVYTDSWMSYHIPKEDKEKRIKLFMPYQVNGKLMTNAKKDAIFMNCLPAQRGYEQTAEVIDGKQSVVFDQAENRLHMQKAIIAFLLDMR